MRLEVCWGRLQHCQGRSGQARATTMRNPMPSPDPRPCHSPSPLPLRGAMGPRRRGGLRRLGSGRGETGDLDQAAQASGGGPRSPSRAARGLTIMRQVWPFRNWGAHGPRGQARGCTCGWPLGSRVGSWADARLGVQCSRHACGRAGANPSRRHTRRPTSATGTGATDRPGRPPVVPRPRSVAGPTPVCRLVPGACRLDDSGGSRGRGGERSAGAARVADQLGPGRRRAQSLTRFWRGPPRMGKEAGASRRTWAHPKGPNYL
jgi:hypothetical protein